MVSLGPSEKPILKTRYLHLMPEDTLIWRRFIRNGQFLPDEVWYDIRVGGGIELPSGQPEWMQRFAEYSYRKRIDIVGRKGRDYYIIECKPGAGIVALGQVIYYSLAFLAEIKPPGEVIPAVITDRVDPDVLPIFNDLEIQIYEVGLVPDADQVHVS